MKGKSYVITGASRGIGFATAKHLSACGANTILVSSCEETLKKAQEDIFATYGETKCSVYPCDLSCAENAGRLFEKIVKECGVPDGLIYCAGVAPLRPVWQTSTKVMNNTFAVNFFSFVEMSRLYLKYAKSKQMGGCIVAISSVSVTHPENGRLAYASSKAALEECVKVLAQEALLCDMRVNLIRSAIADTAMAEEYLTMTGCDVLSVQPLGIIEKEKISDLILYLLSDKADKITGTVFEINAGMI